MLSLSSCVTIFKENKQTNKHPESTLQNTKRFYERKSSNIFGWVWKANLLKLDFISPENEAKVRNNSHSSANFLLLATMYYNQNMLLKCTKKYSEWNNPWQ